MGFHLILVPTEMKGKRKEKRASRAAGVRVVKVRQLETVARARAYASRGIIEGSHDERRASFPRDTTKRPGERR